MDLSWDWKSGVPSPSLINAGGSCQGLQPVCDAAVFVQPPLGVTPNTLFSWGALQTLTYNLGSTAIIGF